MLTPVLLAAALSASPVSEEAPGLQTALPGMHADTSGAPFPEAYSAAPAPAPRYVAPFAEILGLNAGLWAYNRYVADYGFARINLSTMSRNLRHGWVWDEDQFSINQFGHPYQGSFYHSAARVNGHGFYAAMAYTAFGSLQWEYFMENEAPSYNDLLTTTLGGAMLGEISYRVSRALLDPRATGVERAARELLAAAANPVNGLDRLARGETFRVSARPRKRDPRDSTLLRFSTGGVLPYFSSYESSERTDRQRLPRANTEILLIHGDPFAARAPYDYFLFNVGFNLVREPVATINARAQLHGFEIYRSSRQRGMLLVSQNFDYLDNGIYKLGASGVGGGYAHLRRWGSGWFHTLHAQAGVIPLGAVSTEFFRKSSRDYNLGAGAYSHTRLTLGRYGDWFAALVGDRYWIRTRSGAKGDEIIGNSRAEIEYAIWKSLGAMVSVGTYDRTARTRDHGRRTEVTQEARLLLTYGIL